MGKRLKQEYDDGYLMLAYYIVSHNTLPRVRQALHDNNWLRARLREDCVALDLSGPFLDAICQELSADQKLFLRARLKALGDDIFQLMDIERLRREITRIIDNL